MHDLFSALQGVLGGVQLLDREELSVSAREQADRIATSAATLDCLIGILIDSEISLERRARHSCVELRRFLRHMTRRWTGESRAVGSDFGIDPTEPLPERLLVDLVPLARALGNLVSNALRHAPGGGVRLWIGATPDRGLAIQVRDRGPGMPRGWLASEVGAEPVVLRRDGHGLGLHIVRSLAEAMGAELSFADRDGGGSVAELRFGPELCDWSAPGAPSADRTGLEGVRVLLAEDNPTNQMVATQMLRALRAEVTVAVDGVEALERFEEGDFDLVIVDIEMPRMTGLDVIRSIRARRDGRAGMPIVALTAYAMREHRERIAAAGANGLISKPITSVQALGDALRAHVGPIAVQASVSGPKQVESSDVIDRATFEALRAAIGPDMMEELLEKVVADLLQARSDLAGAATPLDRAPVRSASHILISVAGAVGASLLQTAARTLNEAAHDAACSDLPDKVARCVAEIDAVVEVLRDRAGAD